MHGGDVGMVQLGKGQSFLAEAFASGVISQGSGGQYLHGHVAVQQLVVGAMHLAHAARAQLGFNAEMTKRFADHRGKPKSMELSGNYIRTSRRSVPTATARLVNQADVHSIKQGPGDLFHAGGRAVPLLEAVPFYALAFSQSFHRRPDKA